MSATNAFETDLLEHIFQNLDIANIGDATGLRGSSAAGNLYISLHTADPGEAGDQTTSEATYTSYARVAVVRSSSGWTISGNNSSNAAAINFPQATGGSNTITHFGIGTSSSGAGNLLFKGALSASLAVSNGITPSFAIGELDVTCD
jgi:hypothetical protein